MAASATSLFFRLRYYFNVAVLYLFFFHLLKCIPTYSFKLIQICITAYFRLSVCEFVLLMSQITTIWAFPRSFGHQMILQGLELYTALFFILYSIDIVPIIHCCLFELIACALENRLKQAERAPLVSFPFEDQVLFIPLNPTASTLTPQDFHRHSFPDNYRKYKHGKIRHE